MLSEMSPLNHRTESLFLCLLMILGIVTVFLSSSASSMPAKAMGGNMVKLAAPVVPAAYSLRTISNQAAIQGPVIQGWGGVALDEASSGEMQSTLQRLNQSGYNAVRVGFS